jgi:His/Glu/Gln/Arg/opine family amino acid ABC transporter permease subunit
VFSDFFTHVVQWGPQLLRGAELTLYVSIITMVLGTILGAALGLVRERRVPVLSQLIVGYVEILRGLPTILVLFIFYFGFPTAGITISNNPVIVGVLGLTLSLAAYLSEVFRAAIMAVDAGQLEAAKSLGMSTVQAQLKIVLPQAFLVAVPSLGSFFIGLIKDTSLLSFISVSDLLHVGNDIVSATFLSFQVYLIVGALYVLMSIVASRLVLVIEHRLRPLENRTSVRLAGPAAVAGAGLGDRL